MGICGLSIGVAVLLQIVPFLKVCEQAAFAVPSYQWQTWHLSAAQMLTIIYIFLGPVQRINRSCVPCKSFMTQFSNPSLNLSTISLEALTACQAFPRFSHFPRSRPSSFSFPKSSTTLLRYVTWCVPCTSWARYQMEVGNSGTSCPISQVHQASVYIRLHRVL